MHDLDSGLRVSLEHKFRPEPEAVDVLLDELKLTPDECGAIEDAAVVLLEATRARSGDQPLLDAFMQEFGLGNEEGVALMCLAESLLRVPDDATVDALIADKLANRNWQEHVGRADSAFVNASTWGLLLTGALVDEPGQSGWLGTLTRLASRVGEPVIRLAVRQAMAILGDEFVLGRTIEEAVRRAAADIGGVLSFDMLGEGARTMAAADRYLDAYERAIEHVGANAPGSSVSIKLSALHPRYEFAQSARVADELYPRLARLAAAAAAAGCDMAIDAEEADRLNLSVGLFERLARAPEFAEYGGLSFVVQAYGKRALAVVDRLAFVARHTDRVIPVRLVKGAYWDAEVKHAQVTGAPDYPVYTRKANTDLSYLACAERILAADGRLFGQFATHNAHTLVAVRHIARSSAAGDAPGRYEFQRLHGMGTLLYQVAAQEYDDLAPVRVYAPVGEHEDLLAYLVRRLLENGANSSFVNRFLDREQPPRSVVRDPVGDSRAFAVNPAVRQPAGLGDDFVRAPGADLTEPDTVDALLAEYASLSDIDIDAAPTVSRPASAPALDNVNPANGRRIGSVRHATADDVRTAVHTAAHARVFWRLPRTHSSSVVPSLQPRRCWKRARRGRTRYLKCAKPPTSVVTTQLAPGLGSRPPRPCLDQTEKPTPWRCTAAECSRASVPGISRSRFLPGRSPLRSRPATRSLPNPPNRRRPSRVAWRACLSTPGCRRTCCTCCRGRVTTWVQSFSSSPA